MRTTLNINNRLTMVSEMTNDSTFQIFEYDYLKGAADIKSAIEVKHLKDSAIKLKQVRIVLDDSAIKFGKEVLSYMKGSISAVNRQKTNPLGNKFFKNKEVDERYIKGTLQGSGEIFLKPSFGYFSLIELENEEIIINEEIFYACEDSVQVTACLQQTASTVKNGDTGEVRLKLSGEGIVVIELPVPETEIIRCKIYKDRLAVNGEYAVLTTNNVQLTIEKSLAAVSDEGRDGLINVYSGVGEIWLLPTIIAYNNMKIVDFDEEIYHEEEEYEY